MRFYWVRYRIHQNHFQILWEEVKKNLADYVTKDQQIWHYRTIRPKYVKTTKNTQKTQKTGKLGLEEGVMELPIPGNP